MAEVQFDQCAVGLDGAEIGVLSDVYRRVAGGGLYSRGEVLESYEVVLGAQHSLEQGDRV